MALKGGFGKSATNKPQPKRTGVMVFGSTRKGRASATSGGADWSHSEGPSGKAIKSGYNAARAGLGALTAATRRQLAAATEEDDEDKPASPKLREAPQQKTTTNQGGHKIITYEGTASSRPVVAGRSWAQLARSGEEPAEAAAEESEEEPAAPAEEQEAEEAPAAHMNGHGTDSAKRDDSPERPAPAPSAGTWAARVGGAGGASERRPTPTRRAAEQQQQQQQQQASPASPGSPPAPERRRTPPSKAAEPPAPVPSKAPAPASARQTAPSPQLQPARRKTKAAQRFEAQSEDVTVPFAVAALRNSTAGLGHANGVSRRRTPASAGRALLSFQSQSATIVLSDRIKRLPSPATGRFTFAAPPPPPPKRPSPAAPPAPSPVAPPREEAPAPPPPAPAPQSVTAATSPIHPEPVGQQEQLLAHMGTSPFPTPQQVPSSSYQAMARATFTDTGTSPACFPTPAAAPVPGVTHAASSHPAPAPAPAPASAPAVAVDNSASGVRGMLTQGALYNRSQWGMAHQAPASQPLSHAAPSYYDRADDTAAAGSYGAGAAAPHRPPVLSAPYSPQPAVPGAAGGMQGPPRRMHFGSATPGGTGACGGGGFQPAPKGPGAAPQPSAPAWQPPPQTQAGGQGIGGRGRQQLAGTAAPRPAPATTPYASGPMGGYGGYTPGGLFYPPQQQTASAAGASSMSQGRGAPSWGAPQPQQWGMPSMGQYSGYGHDYSQSMYAAYAAQQQYPPGASYGGPSAYGPNYGASLYSSQMGSAGWPQSAGASSMMQGRGTGGFGQRVGAPVRGR